MSQRRRDNKVVVTARLEVRCTEAEKREWLAAASAAKRSLSDWARVSLSDVAAGRTDHKS